MNRLVRMSLVLFVMFASGCSTLTLYRYQPVPAINKRLVRVPTWKAAPAVTANVKLARVAPPHLRFDIGRMPILPMAIVKATTKAFLAKMQNSPTRIASGNVWFPNAKVLHQEVYCLAQNIYYEARGETLRGQLAVANTTINRVKSVMFPNTVCRVVWQPWQFSWTLTHKRWEWPRNRYSWEAAKLIARACLKGGRLDNIRDVTDGAVNFHATYVVPRWQYYSDFVRTVRIDHLIFYRLIPVQVLVDEPVASDSH